MEICISILLLSLPQFFAHQHLKSFSPLATSFSLKMFQVLTLFSVKTQILTAFCKEKFVFHCQKVAFFCHRLAIFSSKPRRVFKISWLNYQLSYKLVEVESGDFWYSVGQRLFDKCSKFWLGIFPKMFKFWPFLLQKIVCRSRRLQAFFERLWVI